jgi:hypothetical protein
MSKNMKKTAGIIGATVLALSLTACGGGGAPASKTMSDPLELSDLFVKSVVAGDLDAICPYLSPEAWNDIAGNTGLDDSECAKGIQRALSWYDYGEDYGLVEGGPEAERMDGEDEVHVRDDGTARIDYEVPGRSGFGVTVTQVGDGGWAFDVID